MQSLSLADSYQSHASSYIFYPSHSSLDIVVMPIQLCLPASPFFNPGYLSSPSLTWWQVDEIKVSENCILQRVVGVTTQDHH